MSATPSGMTLAATGDSIITRSVSERIDRDEAFKPVVDRLRAADVTFSNLEVVVTDGRLPATPPRVVPDQYQYLAAFPGFVIPAPPSVLDELSTLGVDILAAASNHSYDFGRAGMEYTMAALEAREIPYAGLGRDLAAARAPAYVETPAGRVGLVSATTSVPPGGEAGPTGSLVPGATGINPLHVQWQYVVDPEHQNALETIAEATGISTATETWMNREIPPGAAPDGFRFMHMTFEAATDGETPGIRYRLHEPDRRAILSQVEEAAATADFAIMSVHCHQAPGGLRNNTETPDVLVEFAHDCIDAGADAFIGTGPHVLRGIEIYDGRPIFYSLGNFFCQFETIDRLPKQSFDYYGIEDDTRPSLVFDARYFDADGDPKGNLDYPEYWRTVVPTCEFDGDGSLHRIDLLPCSLGRERGRPSRGTPVRASSDQAERILNQLETLSAPFGTEIERDGTVGIIRA